MSKRSSQEESSAEAGIVGAEIGLNGDVVKRLMQMIDMTCEKEYSCEETFALLDEYIELSLTNKEAAALMPLVKQHISMCPDCREEFEALLLAIGDRSPPLP